MLGREKKNNHIRKKQVRKYSKARTCVCDATLIIRSRVEKREMVFNGIIDAKTKALVKFLKEESLLIC